MQPPQLMLGANKIQRANLDGSEVEDLVTGLNNPSDLAVDTVGGKIYWTDGGNPFAETVGKLQRANIDGSEVEDLPTREGLREFPHGIAVDGREGKIYWSGLTFSATDASARIQRANLDGSDAEDIFIGDELFDPQHIALMGTAPADAGPADTTPPTIVAATVKDGDTDVDPESLNQEGITVQFSESVQPGEIEIFRETGVIVEGMQLDRQQEERISLGWEAAWTKDSVTLVMGGGAPLEGRATYVIEIRDVTDAAGNPLDVGRIAFTTGEEKPLITPVEPRGKLPITLGQIKRTALFQNYPNPFNPETWIPYQLAEESTVEIRIYNASGQLVQTLPLGQKPAGVYASQSKSAYWGGQNDAGEQIPSGVYFYSLHTSNFSETRKMTVLK